MPEYEADFERLAAAVKEAGAIAFTDGDRSVPNARVFRRALAYAATFDALVISHAEDPELVRGASATEGEFAMGWAKSIFADALA